ncbi:MAG: hypothetical protein LBI62_01695, partial [Candidatus Accumulibacter sp.]|nr:hypothetical protein [Accumulibacter sp.]
ELRQAKKSGDIARKLQPYLAQVSKDDFQTLQNSGAIKPVVGEEWGKQFMELVNKDIYDEHLGLCVGRSDLRKGH